MPTWFRKKPAWLSRAFSRRKSRRVLRLEQLCTRDLLSNVPLGASVNDTAEFMLGDIVVNVVLLESNGAVDNNTENWTSAQIADVKQRIEQGAQWWENALANFSPNSYLKFHFDYTFADSPLSTSYEPIARPSDDYPLWVDEFLYEVGYLSNGQLSDDIRAYNHSQRVSHDANWSFTIFVVNNASDADKQFALNGSFLRSFAFSGGQFIVLPADRPASTVAHEIGHMFWAVDEYPGGDFYTMHRGYYDTQAVNAADGHPNPAQRQPSIMASDALFTTAYDTYTSSPSTFALVGWQDSDGDGILDVLDVPFTLRGSGYFDAETGTYKFFGDAWVNTLPNRNTEGTRNDMTINKIREIQYRVDGGSWITLQTADDYKTSLTLTTPVLPQGAQQIEIRAIDTRTGVASNIFTGLTDRPTSTLDYGVGGFVFRDLDGDGVWDENEPALRNWEITLLSSSGQPIGTPGRVEPDQFGELAVLNTAVQGVTLTAFGSGVANNQVLASTTASAATGTKAFANRIQGSNQVTADWTAYTRQLRIDFDSPTNMVRIDAFGAAAGSVGRLEIYSTSGVLLGRYTTAALSGGSRETMFLERPTADIAYAIVRGHGSGSIRVDNLRFGPDASDKTDSQGAYWIPAALAGSFQLQITAPDGVNATFPTSGVRTINIVPGQPLPNLDFGVQFAASWQNITNVYDVDNDGATLIKDALALVEEMTTIGPRVLPTLASDAPLPTKFLDVSGDGKLTARDLLLVIEELAHLTSGVSGEAHSANLAASGEPASHHNRGSAPTSPQGEPPVVDVANENALRIDAWASWYGGFLSWSSADRDQSVKGARSSKKP